MSDTLHVILDSAVGKTSGWSWSNPLLVTVAGAIVAATGGLLARYAAQAADNRRAKRSVRTTLYSQIHRVAELVTGQIDYAQKLSNPPYILIPVSDVNLPSLEMTTRIEALTWREVYEVTSFLSSYHEQVGYLLGNARPEQPLLEEERSLRYLPWGVTTHAQVFGYDLSEPERRQWFIDALLIIYGRANRARAALAEQLNRNAPIALAALIKRHGDRAAPSRAGISQEKL